MPPKRLKKKDVVRMVQKRLTEAIAKYERNRSNPENVRGSGPANAGGVVARDVHGYGTPEKKKTECYIRGLPKRVKANVTSSKPASLHDAINMAHELIEQAIQAKVMRIGESNKRKCKALHHGLCSPRCGKCQKVGHHEKNIRVRAPTTGGNFLQNVTCFGCRQKGQYRNKFPKGKDQRNPNVVTVFTPFIDIAPAALDTSYDVEIVDGKVVSTNTVLRGYTLALFNHVFKIDLLLTRLGSFDVIVGID
ncbi:hypothetical protein Tco_1538491 [Tanacetum coccineum]